MTMRLAQLDAEHLAGIHLNMPRAAPAALKALGELTAAEQAALDALRHYRRWEAGYSTQQATRPQTLGYGLVDSPAAQCAWIVEKFFAWTDCDGHPENAVARDVLLDNVMLYWLPATGYVVGAAVLGELLRPGAHADRRAHRLLGLPQGAVPALRALGAHALWRPAPLPREAQTARHFAALEQPAVFVDEVRTFFRTVRHA
ncbi:MAG: hypothetical protein R2736_20480 [Solirubrobacterales bacterium]